MSHPGEIIPHPALIIGLTVQPEVLRSLLARAGFYGRGLLARFLYALPNATLGDRSLDAEPVHHPIRTEYHRRIGALLALTHPPHSSQSASISPDCSPARTCSNRPILLPGLPNHDSADASRLTFLHPADASRLPLPIAMERGSGGGASSSSSLAPHPWPLPFSPSAAGHLREFARSVEPRLAPDGDLDPIDDWASKLVGATARIAGLLHLASLDLACSLPLVPSELPPVTVAAVESAIALADYLAEHARAAYASIGFGQAIAHVPELLAWIRRTDLTTFTRRDARRPLRSRIRSDADLDDALQQLEQHGYIRLRLVPTRGGPGRRPSPSYDVNPAVLRR